MKLINNKIWQILAIVLLINTAGCYIFTQSYYQIKLLSGARSIKKVLKRKKITNEQREKLNLVLEIRQYAKNNIGLKVANIYSKVNLKWDKNIYNVVACPPLSFDAYTWWFPIVGNVPYKGFFSKKAALKEESVLKQLDYETMIYKVGGYSTLGFFADPIWPSMLQRSVASLTELLFHELTHATLYIKNHTQFNESLATFVGQRAAAQFIEQKYGADSEQYINTLNFYYDENLFKKTMFDLYNKLNKMYMSKLNTKQKLKQKQKIIDNFSQNYHKIAYKTTAYQQYMPSLNNAYLASFYRYNKAAADFENLLASCGYDWKKFFKALQCLKNDKDPFHGLHLLLRNKGGNIQSSF